MRDPLTPATLLMWGVVGVAAVLYHMTRLDVREGMATAWTVLQFEQRSGGRTDDAAAAAISVTGIVKALDAGKLRLERHDGAPFDPPGTPPRRHVFDLNAATWDQRGTDEALRLKPGDVVTVVYEASTGMVGAVRLISAGRER